MGEFDDALRLLEVAYMICPDKGSLIYAHLYNSAAVIYFELNDLKKSKIKNDIAFEIRVKLLPKDNLELANCYHNQGLLEGARGRQDQLLAFHNLAEQARIKAGEEALISLGLGNLISGRALFLKSQFREGRSALRLHFRSEVLAFSAVSFFDIIREASFFPPLLTLWP